MIQISKLAALFALISLFSCQYHYQCDDPLEIEEVGFVDYEVDFFTSHPDWVYLPAEYETVTEQILVKEAHLEGAHFELLMETVQVKEPSTRIEIEESEQIVMVQNAETFSATEISCYHFFQEEDIMTIDIPAEYKTLTRQAVILQGTGQEVPAEYGTVSKRKLKTPAQLLPPPGEREFERVIFRIPDTLTISEYLFKQIPAPLFDFCEEGRSYRIN